MYYMCVILRDVPMHCSVAGVLSDKILLIGVAAGSVLFVSLCIISGIVIKQVLVSHLYHAIFILRVISNMFYL